MIKSELNMFLSQLLPEVSEKKIAEGSKRIILALAEALEAQQRIELRGFGSFCLHHRSERLAFNPKTGKRVHADAKSIPHFKPGKSLKLEIEESRLKFPIEED
jgi:integration host factor subunit beta